MATLDPRVRLAFGPFELDAPARELRKRGVRVRLAGQPFQILCCLLVHAGDLVTREDLRKYVWSDGTFVDFEGGLNAAMAKLRRALGDSAENPRYIETVPRHGYRFIGSIQKMHSSDLALEAEPEMSPVAAGAETLSGEEKDHSKGPQSHRKGWIPVSACLTAIALGAVIFIYLRRTPALTGKGTIVLADFVNRTGDSVFDGTLQQGLMVQLQQSPFLSVLSEERVQQTLRFMGQAADARLTPALAREICERTGSAAFLEGSIALLGSRYVLGLNAKSCNGDILDEEQFQAARKDDVLNALTRIAKQFRGRAGESLATIRQHETPLAEATTPSLEALKAYSGAGKAAVSTGFSAAVPLLQRAIELDPQFAMAHAFLGRVYGDIGDSVLSAESTAEAYRLRNRAGDREKFFITFSYDRQITGNLENAQKTLELWAQTYPRDADPHSLLSGFTTLGTAQYGRTIEEAKKAITLNPDATPAYLNLAAGFLALGRVAEAENALVRADGRKLEIADSLMMRYYIAFLRNDAAGMDRVLARAKDKPGAEDSMLHLEALVSAYSGHLQQARMLSERAIGLARRKGRLERAAIYRAGAAVWEGFFGNAAAARRSAMAALELSNARDVEYGATFALALAGDSSRSHKLADELERRFLQDTFVRFSYGPTLRALFALNQTARSTEILQPAAPYELALPGVSLLGGFGGLYPVYVRGAAYLTAHQGREAAAEFQKILDHRGIVLADPVGAAARLQLGRAFALSGEKDKARTAFRDFLTLWKDADPDIPTLKQAKAEYAKLQ